MKILKFPENLKNAIAINKITQKELAKKLGTTQQTISRWMKGSNEPNFETLLEICLFLNETPDDILGYSEINETILKKYECKNNISNSFNNVKNSNIHF